MTDKDSDESGKPLWGIRFDGRDEDDIEHYIPSSTLQILKDKRVFKWTVVKDSHPTRPLEPFLEHGVVGVDYEKLFSKESLDVHNANYGYPFLKLLIHLWPGKFKVVYIIVQLRVILCKLLRTH